MIGSGEPRNANSRVTECKVAAGGGPLGITQSSKERNRVERWRMSPATLSEHLYPAMPELGFPTGE